MAEAFLAWKNMTAWVEIECPCGENICINEDFAYAIACLACGRTFVMPTLVEVQVIPLDQRGQGAYSGIVVSDQEQEIRLLSEGRPVLGKEWIE